MGICIYIDILKSQRCIVFCRSLLYYSVFFLLLKQNNMVVRHVIFVFDGLGIANS